MSSDYNDEKGITVYCPSVAVKVLPRCNDAPGQRISIQFMFLALAIEFAILMAVLGAMGLLVGVLTAVGVPLLAISVTGVAAVIATSAMLLAAPIVAALAFFAKKMFDLATHSVLRPNNPQGHSPLSPIRNLTLALVGLIATAGAACLALGIISLLCPAFSPALLAGLASLLALIHITSGIAPSIVVASIGAQAILPFVLYVAASVLKAVTHAREIGASLASEIKLDKPTVLFYNSEEEYEEERLGIC